MNFPLEQLLGIANNRYALVEILSQRSIELRNRDETLLISKAINQSIDELLGNKITFTNYDK